MKAGLQKKPVSPSSQAMPPKRWHHHLRTWLLSWEIYVIVLVAAFLRLYQINTTEFDADQADVYRMAYDAVHHGLLVATSNISSLHAYNPPATIYLLMLPAAFSPNPLWGAVMVALLAIAAVLLTYLFTRRYYGRLAATFAGFLYATAALPVFYSRFIWNQNLLLLFVPLFIITLFWGVVERRKGWLFPALFLLGLLFQLHGSGILLGAALFVALFISPGTIQWHDVVLGLLSLLLLFAPFLLWETHTHFYDILALFNPTGHQSQFDNQALLFYQQFLSPYIAPFTNTQSLLFPLIPALSWVNKMMVVLIIAAGVVVLGLIIDPQHIYRKNTSSPQDASIESASPDKAQTQHTHSAIKVRLWGEKLRHWWSDFRANPYRCGLLLLLIWQTIPLLYLSRHSIDLYAHYFIMLMPGPFILISILLAKIVAWFQQPNMSGLVVRVGVYLLLTLIIVSQCVASTASVLDQARGNFKDSQLSYPYYNDLHSLQNALSQADQVAQQQHFHHIYLSSEGAMESALRYLAPYIHTPTTVFNDACIVLPDPAKGPALLLLGPHSDVSAALVARFASATLVDEPKRLGGPPFKLYIVNTEVPHTSAQATFPQELQLFDAQSLRVNNAPWIGTRWQMMRADQPDFRTTYAYTMTNVAARASNTQTSNRQCVFSSIQQGEQLLLGFQISEAKQVASSVDIMIQSYTITPQVISLLGIGFETFGYSQISRKTLHTTGGMENIVVASSNR